MTMDRASEVRHRLILAQGSAAIYDLLCPPNTVMDDLKYLLDTLTRERAERWVKYQEFEARLERLEADKREAEQQWAKVTGQNGEEHDRAGSY